MKRILRFFRRWILLVAIGVGAVGHSVFAPLFPLAPWLLMAMLLFTFSAMPPRDIRFHPLHAVMIAVQVAGSLLTYVLLEPFSPVVAQSVSICLLVPTATAAPTITGMLGGNVGFLVAYLFLGTFSTILFAPLIIPMIAPGQAEVAFLASAWSVFTKVAPTLLIPLFVAWGLQRFAPKANACLVRNRPLSFYLWALMILAMVGSTFEMLLAGEKEDWLPELGAAALGALVCASQFFLGWRIGEKFHKRISAGQALAQKNIALAMWLALQYFDPLAVVSLAAYSVTQNIFNSLQIRRKDIFEESVRRRLHEWHGKKRAESRREA